MRKSLVTGTRKRVLRFDTNIYSIKEKKIDKLDFFKIKKTVSMKQAVDIITNDILK